MKTQEICLDELVMREAGSRPDALAIFGAGRSMTYGELDRVACRFAAALHAEGVGRGDRVVFCGPKSCDAVALFQGALRLGAAYVPLDPATPLRRLEAIVADARPALVVVERHPAELSMQSPSRVCSLGTLLERSDRAEHTPRLASGHTLVDLAYILYTSGSTGTPKGVCISHRNAMAFVDWAAGVLGLHQDDRLANHAPFSFDLSVLDLYGAFRVGASVHLMGEMMSFAPTALVQFLLDRGITVLYCVPSALMLMMDEGRLLLQQSRLSLRNIIFAGEVFPVAPLSRLRTGLPGVRLLNFYGPTETNVCAYHEVEDSDLTPQGSVPIGRAACGDELLVQSEDGRILGVGEEGELTVRGPTVMLGYWGRDRAPDDQYRTGDIVRVLEDGKLQFIGRRDQMVKVRGRRIELGEIEAVLGARPEVRDAAVMVTGEGIGARLKAFVVAVPGSRAPTLLDVKRWCAERLPSYMVVEDLELRSALPRNARGKLERAKLS